MTNRLKLTVLMLLIMALALSVLASCTSVGIASVEIKDDCDYKTEYVIGDELDLTGLELVVTRTDGEVYTVFATDVREDIKILNFKTDKAVESLNVVIEYKGVATSITIKVTDKDSATAKYTVTFSTGEGQRIEPIMAGEFETISAPDDPTREGYVFDGWYKQSTYNDQWDFNIDKVVEDTTLYAKWSKLYSITFKYDPVYNDIPDVVKYVKAGGSLTDVPALPHVEGMVGSWSRTTFADIYSNIVVNAEYVTATYRVVFCYMDGDERIILKTFENVPHGADLGELYSQEIENLSKNEVPQNSADGTKHFSGKWSQSYNHVVSDLTIEALYEINKYNVSFLLNYGENEAYTTATGITHNNPVNRPATDPVREGYAFDGWFKNAEGTEGYAWNFNTDRVTSNTRVYAKWTKLYYVRYWVDEELYQTIEVREGTNATKAPLPIKEGYTASWYIGETLLNDDALQNIVADKDISAKFTINSYTVTFFNNFDGTTVDVQTVNYGSDAVRPTTLPKRLGYKFVSWGSTDEEGNEIEYKNIKIDTVVPARFEADSYQVTIVPNVAGLENSYNVTAVYDALIGSDSETATRLELSYEGYNFDGWYTDNAWTKSWNLGANVLNVNSLVKNTLDKENQTVEEKTAEIEGKFATSGNVVMTLYAKWSKIHTVLIYDENDIPFNSTTIIDGNYLDRATLPEIAEKEGMTGDWYLRGDTSTPFDFTQPIKSNVALAIAYKVKVYTVNFYKGVGDFHYSVNVEHNGQIQSNIPDPVVEGKIFEGWDKDLNQIIVEDTDYMAIFSPVFYTVTWSYNGITYATTSVEHGKQAIFPVEEELPTQEGYKLVRWVPVGDESLDINNVKSNMNVIPEWNINTYTVEFRDKETNDIYLQYDGQAEQEYQLKSHGQAIDVDSTVANPVKEGKDFVGWTIGNRTIKYNNDLSSWVLSGSYDNDNVYSVGDSMVSLIIRDDQYYYSFETPATISNMIASDIWDENKIIEFTASTNGWALIRNSTILSEANNLAFSGHLFYVVTSNIVLYSNHVISVYEISYVTNTDTDIDARAYEHGAISVAPIENLEKTDYVFIGWYTEPEFRNKYTFGTAVTSDITLYARWEEKRDYTENVIYTLNESGTAYTLTGLGEGFNEKNVVVANFYGNPGLPVDSIGAEAFKDNDIIETIDLPNTLLNIGPGAFMNMSKLVSIDIPETISIIPDNAFNGATALETVSFGDYPVLTTIGKNAFAKATSLKYSVVNGNTQNFTLPESLTTIESGAFLNCTAFDQIYIPANVIDIGDNAFAGANGLRYAVFSRTTPANLGENVFQNYTSLQNAFRIYVPSSVMYTSGAANANWKLLKDKIYESANIIKIEGVAEWSYTLTTDGRVKLIQYMGSMTEVAIPEFVSLNGENVRVAEIGDYAFDGRITSVSLDAVVGISANTFASTEVLTNLSITIGSNNSINSTYLYDAYSNVSTLNTLSVSPNVTILDLFGGSAPTALTTVKTLAGSNNQMSPSFLANCVYVKEVIINGRTENVSQDAFLNCTALERVVFDNRNYTDLKKIEANAFKGAISLDTFEIVTNSGSTYGIPQTVDTIGADAFDGTKWLNANDNDMIIVGKGILYRYNGSESIVAIPASVTAITANAFSGNVKLRQVYVIDIENSKLVNIGEGAFANCVNLEVITLPATVEVIGASAFEGDNKLASVIHFGDGEPNNIGEYAFNKTHSEMKVYLPSTASAWSSPYQSSLIKNIKLYEENRTADEKWVWVYGDAIGNETNAIIIIKAFGMVGGNSKLTVPEQLAGKDVYEIADYALPRTIESLEYSTFIKNVGLKPFGGVTFVKEITLRNSYNDHRVSPEAMMSLFVQNESVSVLNTVASVSLKSLLGGVLPANVKTVNILDNSTSIAQSFLEDNIYVENITLTVYDKEGDTLKNPVVVNLEETLSMSKAHKFTSIGAKAFRNTAWMNAYDGEYVIVLGGNLVDYKGANSILEIPSTVENINGSIFENDEFIEVVTIPATVKSIGRLAFNGANNLTKIFINATTAPTIYGDTFDNDVLTYNGLEIFVPASAIDNATTGYARDDWKAIKPLSNSGIVHVKNQVSHNVYEEYIINSAENKLLLSRKYKATYSGTLVTEIVENVTAIAPTVVTDKSTGAVYNITALGNNVFMSAVQNIVLDLSHTINTYTLKNLGEIGVVTISGNTASRNLQGSDIINIFNAHSAQTIAYDGAVTLTELVGQTGGIGSLVGVKIIDGVKETADELLKGWTDVASVTFPATIERVGINSLEDTSWYKDYASTTYGNDFVVLGGSLLYKYKGAGIGMVTIPSAVKIINTGAFSNYDGSAWSSALYVKQIRFDSASKAHTILDYAFSGCTQLNSILLPTSMSNIAPNAFDNTAFNVTDGMLIVSGDNDEEATLVKFVGTESDLDAGTLTIPSKVKKIAAGAFQNVTVIKKITYNNDSILTRICEDAFNGATALETVQLPSSVEFIGKNAFYNTLWLGKEIQKGADVTIGSILYQRVNVSSGSTYTLSDNVTSIVEDALVSIEPFTIGGETYYTSDSVKVTAFEMVDGSRLPQAELYSVLSKEWMTSLRTNGQVTLSGLIGSDEPLDNITSLSFWPGITSIVAGYAENWSNVTSITNISSTVTEIGENAFRGTAWFDNQNKEGFNFAGESRVVIKFVGDATDIIIGEYYGERVTGITADAFKGNENLKSVVFGEYSTIEKIPAGAFSGCVNLETIVFNDNITEYGEDAFANTAWLLNSNSDFVIIDGVMIEYKGAGGDIVIPDGTIKIYPYVFRGNDTITSVTFAKNCLMTAIEANTFRDCVNLEEIILNEYITHVDRSAVEGTAWLSLTSQSNDNPVLYYENTYYGIKRAVLYVGTKSSFTLLGDVSEITPTAFKDVQSLTYLTINSGKLTAIPDGAFMGCLSLDEVNLPATITQIGEDAFYGTPYLTKQKAEFFIKNGILIRYNGTSSNVVIPAEVTLIERGVFEGSSVVSIDMSGTNIETILNGTFAGLASLTDVVFSSATTYIGEGAFSGTAYLNNAPAGLLIVNDVALIAYVGDEAEVVIPAGIRYLNADVFQGKSNLENITFEGEIEIAPNAFKGVSSLGWIDGVEYIVGVGEGAFSGTQYEQIQIENGFVVVNGFVTEYKGNDTEIVIPADVEYIPEGIFTDNTNITSVDFSAVVGSLSIEANAFRNAINLSNVVLSDNIDYLGNRAFYNTAWLNSYGESLIISSQGKLLAYVGEGSIVNIPNTVKTFARDVFKGNKNITTVQFATGSNVVIPAEAFKDCTSLFSIGFNGTFDIGENAFQNTDWYKEEAKKTANKGFVIVNGGLLIGYEGTATDIEIPSKVTYIYDYVFKGNENITSLTFASGSAITSIKGETFVGCTQLTQVNFKPIEKTLLELDMDAFEGTPWKANLPSDFVVVGNKLLAYVGNGGDVVIPSAVGDNTILEISANVFKGNTTITSISFGVGSYLNTIPAGAFEGCVNLEKVTFPEDIEYVGKDAFKGTKWLENISNGNLGEGEQGTLINDIYVIKGKALFYVGIKENLVLYEDTAITTFTKSTFEGSTVKVIYAYFTNPALVTIADGAFDSIEEIWVPEELLEIYRTAWSSVALKIVC